MIAAGQPRFRAGYGRGDEWLRAVRSCLAQLDPLPEGADVGFLYLGEGLGPFADVILRELRTTTGIERWVGAGGHAALAAESGSRPIAGLAVLVGRFGRRGARLLDQAAGQVPAGAAAIVHAEHGAPGLEASLAALAAKSDAYLLGITTARHRHGPQLAGDPLEGELSGLVLDDTVALLPMAARSCRPLGRPCRVTSRVGREIFGLDGVPALDLVLGRMGDLARARPSRVVEELLVGRPAQGGGGAMAAVARLVGLGHERRSLLLEPCDLDGPEIVLLQREAQTAEAELHRALDQLARQLAGRRPAALLYFCAADRLQRLAAAGIDEVAIVLEALGRPPMVGLAGEAVIIDGRPEPCAAVAAVLL